MRGKLIQEVITLLNKAEDICISRETRTAEIYFDYCVYQKRGLESWMDEISVEDLKTLKKSSKAIIKICELEEEITYVYG